MKGFSVIVKQLYDLVRKGASFQFDEKEWQAFQTLKSKLVEAPILCFYNVHDDTELHCDASLVGFGAVLLQRKADKNMHQVMYFSKRTSDVGM